MRDEGTGIITIDKFNLTMHLLPYNQDGSLQFSFRDAEIMIEDFEVKLDGKAEISDAIEAVVREFKQ